MHRSAILPLLAPAILLSACSDEKDPIGPAPSERYTATVAGALVAELAGPAAFGSDPNDGDPVFAIVLGNASSEHVLVLARAGTNRPGVGSYDILNPFLDTSDDGWTALHLVVDGDLLIASFIGISGRLTITDSGVGQLKGTFQYDAQGFFESDPGADPIEVAVSGSFDAGQSTNIAGAAGLRTVLRLRLH